MLFLSRKYPLSTISREVSARMHSFGTDLGLSPASRAKISTIGEPPEADPLEKLLAKKRERQQPEARPN
jgi:phage terminase small subunit